MLDPIIEKRFENVSKSKTFKNIISLFDLDKKRVLDAGCSYGEFLSHFGSNSTGITILKQEVEYGREKGLNVIYANLEDGAFRLDDKFEVVFCNNLFEHLLSPNIFLYNLKKFLKPGGFLILGVPCIPRITSLMRMKKFKGSLAGSHINFFTRETLIKTVERAGWTVLETRGFRFKVSFLDRLLNWIYPHFYVVARVDQNYQLTRKRMSELAGYNFDTNHMMFNNNKHE